MGGEYIELADVRALLLAEFGDIGSEFPKLRIMVVDEYNSQPR